MDTEDLSKECKRTILKIQKEVEERQKTTMEHIEQILRQFQREKSDLTTGNDKLRR